MENGGGQRGCGNCLLKQAASLSNPANPTFEKIGEIDAIPNRIQAAAMWLHLNRSALAGPAIPAIKERFGLRNLEAIEATKQAHALAFPGA